MKTTSVSTTARWSRTPFAITAGVVLCGWLVAQQPQPYPPLEQPPPKRDKIEKRDTQRKVTDMPGTAAQIMKVNKASGLIGMEGRGSDGKELGKIHDLVFDLKSDRVAYCVLNSQRGLLGAAKLHAVPLRAFQACPDGSHLTLNADPEKLARAEGFDRDNWPSLANPTWGAEPFWQDSPGLGKPSTDLKPIPPTDPGKKEHDHDRDLPSSPGQPEPQ
jgi:sporulation protein YlmC with PRC-barrel domain